MSFCTEIACIPWRRFQTVVEVAPFQRPFVIGSREKGATTAYGQAEIHLLMSKFNPFQSINFITSINSCKNRFVAIPLRRLAEFSIPFILMESKLSVFFSFEDDRLPGKNVLIRLLPCCFERYQPSTII
jgi:hypothetical protein